MKEQCSICGCYKRITKGDAECGSCFSDKYHNELMGEASIINNDELEHASEFALEVWAELN